MNEPNEIVTWKKYKQLVTDLVKNNRLLYCRGQKNPDWKLQTSFHRAVGGLNISLTSGF